MVSRGSLVLVKWWDTTTHTEGWIDDDDAIAWAKKVPALATSTGYVLLHDETFLLLAAHCLDGMCAEPTRIPSCCIFQIEKLHTEGEGCRT